MVRSRILRSLTFAVALLTTGYSIPPGGGQVFDMTGSSNAAPSVGHARINGDSNPPTGIAIIDYQTSGVLLSQAGVPATAETRSGMAYVDIGGPVNTGLAIANQSQSSAVIDYFFTDASGANIKQGSLTLNANHQLAAFLNSPPFSAPTPFRGTFTFNSTVPVAVIATRGLTNERNEFVFSTMPIATATPTGDPLLPMFADGGGWNTEILLTNASVNTITGTVEFFDQGSSVTAATPLSLTVNGSTGTAFTYSIPPRSMHRMVTQGLTSETARSGSVRVTANVVNPFTSSPPNAFAILSFKSNNVTVTETSVFAVPTSTAFRVYVESSSGGGQGQILSGVAVANASANANAIILELTGLDGSAIGPTQALTLAGRGQTSKFLHELFPNLPSDFRGILRIISTAPIGVVDLRARYNLRQDFLVTTIPPVNELASATGAVVFPHLVTGGGYNTQVILFGQPGTGTLSFTSTDGVPIDGAMPAAP